MNQLLPIFNKYGTPVLHLSIGLIILAVFGIPTFTSHAQGDKKTVDQLIERINQAISITDRAKAIKALDQVQKQVDRHSRSVRSNLEILRLLKVSNDILRAKGQLTARSYNEAETKNVRDKIDAINFLTDAAKGYEHLFEKADLYLDKVESRSVGDPMNNSTFRETSALLNQAEYYRAWSWYEVGVITTNEHGRLTAFENAMDSFRNFTSRGYVDDDPIISECFLGYALCLFELGQFHDIITLLKPAKVNNTPTEIFRRISWLRLKTYMAIPSNLKAANAARDYFKTLPADHRFDQIELGMMIDRARALAALADPEANPLSFRRYERELDQVRKAVQAYGSPWTEQLTDMIKVVNAELATSEIEQARDLFNQGKYTEARQIALDGLNAQQNDQVSAKTRADLQYIAILCAWNLENYLEAYAEIESFIEIYSKDVRLPQLIEIAFVAADISRKNNQEPNNNRYGAFLNRVNQLLNRDQLLDRRYWAMSDVLQQSDRTSEAIEFLNRIEEDSELYAVAQIRIAVYANHQIDQLMKDQSVEKMHLLSAAPGIGLRALQRYFQTRHDEELKDRTNGKDRQAITLFVNLAQRSFELGVDNDSLISEEIERLQKVPAVMDSHPGVLNAFNLRLIAKHKDISVYLREIRRQLDSQPALTDAQAANFVLIADDLEQRSEQWHERDNQSTASQIDRTLLGIYSYLDRYISKTASEKERDARLLPVYQRNADTLLRLGEHEDAQKLLNLMLSKMQKNKSGHVMRLLAMSYESTGQFKEAVKHWQTLAKGLPEDSEPWLEARYHWGKCLSRLGSADAALKLLEWTQLRSRALENSSWREPFEELIVSLKQSTAVQ